MNSKTPQELDWLAFQYVADELSAPDRAAFEERLETDQAAREAVARGVELSLAVQAAYREDALGVAARDRLIGKSSRGWWSVAVAACALLALIAVSQFTRNAGEAWRRAGTNDEQLAIAWSETRAVLPTSAILSVDDDNTLLDDDLLAMRVDEEAVVALPTWMVAAVSDAARGTVLEPSAPQPVENRTAIE